MRNQARARTARLQTGWVALALLASISLSTSCTSGGSTPATSIRVGSTKSEVNALIVIALERGYFRQHGLDVVHEIYPSGVAAIDGMFAREVDVATGSEFAFVDRVLAEQDIRALAVINRSSLEHIVVRVDRGIHSIGDLVGKTIGVPMGSRPEFALDRFLFYRGINRAEVTLVHVPVDESVDALVDGQVDAIATWQPYVDEAQKRMGSGVVTWSAQEDQPSYTLLMSRGEWAADHREPLGQFLRALVEAEEWVTGNPEAAREFIHDRWDYSEAYVASIWPDHTYRVLLDQTLIVVMEDQARWLIERNAAGQAHTPNFLRHIYFEPLEAARPEAVNVIR